MKRNSKPKYNKSTVFILPMLRYHRSFYEPYLVNAYIDCEEPYLDEDYIYILLKYKGVKKFYDIETKLYDHPDYRANWDLCETSYVMFCFAIPQKFVNDFELFKKGSYSLMSNNIKELIVNCSSNKKTIKNIFKKHKILKSYWEGIVGQTIYDQEVWPIWNKEEVFKKELLPANIKLHNLPRLV